MKWFIFSFLLLSFGAQAISHKELVSLPREKRAEIIKEYREFLRNYSQSIKLSQSTPDTLFEIISSAYASELNCVYGGWPSSRINGLCSRPRNNPAFERQSCSANEFPCQPLLFGQGLCVPSATRQQRQATFASCEQKFSRSGKSLSDVVEYLSDPEVSGDADELFSLIDGICKTGSQSTTSMCTKLRNRVAEIQSQLSAPEPRQVVVESKAERTEAVLMTAATEASSLEAIVQSLNLASQCVTCQTIKEQTTDEPQRTPATSTQSSNRIPFERINSGFDLAACSSSSGTRYGYSIKRIGQCNGTPMTTPAGFFFSQGPTHPHVNVETRYLNGTKPGRNFELVSRNHALNETYLVLEEYGGGPDSHNVKSYMFVIPRVTVPSVREEGENVVATLATGEEVTIRKSSGAIISGALNEGPIDLNTDRFQRRQPNIHYGGTGISIRLNHRYEHPLTNADTATVKQGGKTCQVPRAQLFNVDGQLKTSSDAELLTVLNARCGGGFRI